MSGELATEAREAESAPAVAGWRAASSFTAITGPSQYCSKTFADVCRRAETRRSVGAVGTWAYNAAAESFLASLKREFLPNRRGRPAERAARLALFRRLGFYNHQRSHSTIGHLAPAVFAQSSTTPTITV
ncbi:integrase core domain-containing protein [Streptomyces sp. NPDC048665]|uniref:integrase core domain-containing protein n=1 Tax=Streptomyces sp. NPDC048665 TaxID=3155490 RepID=UPI00341861BE